MRIADTNVEGRKDLSVPGGCPTCGGDLAVRVSPGSSRGVCGACRAVSRPSVRIVHGQVLVQHRTAGLA